MAFVSSADQRATAESGVVVQMEILYIAVLRTSHAAAQFVPPFFNFSSLSCLLNPTVSSFLSAPFSSSTSTLSVLLFPLFDVLSVDQPFFSPTV